MATGDTLTTAKAWVATGFGLLAPGAAYVAAAAIKADLTGNDWIIAAALCITGGAIAGGTVYAVENKPKTGGTT